ncbi:MAG: hypothetical protein JWP89_3151 [Schlesneria sp.]|nr:hypothetical protein [Schlesneria sp.]
MTDRNIIANVEGTLRVPSVLLADSGFVHGKSIGEILGTRSVPSTLVSHSVTSASDARLELL